MCTDFLLVAQEHRNLAGDSSRPARRDRHRQAPPSGGPSVFPETDVALGVITDNSRMKLAPLLLASAKGIHSRMVVVTDVETRVLDAAVLVSIGGDRLDTPGAPKVRI